MINLLLHLLLLLVLLLVPLTSCTSHHPPILQLATLCEGGGGKVVLGPSPVLLSFSGTSGLGTCHLQLTPPPGGLGLSLFTQRISLQESPRCTADFIQFGKSFLFFAQTKSPKFCANVDSPGNKTDPVRLVSNPREWVERESGEIHLWLAISQSLANKQVQILVTPFRVSCGPTERHWVHCIGANACIRRTTLSTVPDGPLVSSGLPISLLLIAALVLVFSFLFCGLFLRLGLQYLVRKSDDLSGCDEVGGFGQGGDSESLEEVATPSAPPLPSSPASCAPLPPPPTYNEAVASSPPPKQGAHHLLQAHPQVQPPPYSLLVGPSGPCLARSYTADNS